MSHDLSVKAWDGATKQGKERIMVSIYNTYSILGVEDFDISKLNDDLGKDVCLLLPRIAAALEATLRKNESFRPHVLGICALLSSQIGQEFALSSSVVVPTLMKCMQCEINGNGRSLQDFAILLKMIRKICAFSDALRAVVFHLRGLQYCSQLLQKCYKSEEAHNAGCALILDLATVAPEASVLFSNLLRAQLTSPHLRCKLSAIRLMTSSIATKCNIRLDLSTWADDASMHIARVLLCAPVVEQYDTAELLSLLFEDETMQLRAMTLCSAVLCLRYTVGGNSIVSPPAHWNLRFPVPEGADKVSEVPELLVCNIISTVLGYIDSADSKTLEEKKRAKERSRFLTSLMRRSKLHRSLLAHVLWYVREKTVLHKVISMWNTGGIEQPLPPSETLQSRFPEMETSKLRKLSTIARRWRTRKSTLRRGSAVTPPELHRASAMLRSNKAEEDKEGTAQDMCCIRCMRVLQKWVDLDRTARDEILEDFKKFGYEDQVAYMSTMEEDGVIDILRTISNVIWIITSEGKAAVVMGKKSFLSTYLSGMINPGELVKNVKVALGDAHAQDCSAVCPLDPSYDMSMSTEGSYNPALFSDSLSSPSHSRMSTHDRRRASSMGGMSAIGATAEEAPEGSHTSDKTLQDVDGELSGMIDGSSTISVSLPVPTPPSGSRIGSKHPPRRSPSKSSYVRQVLPPSAPNSPRAATTDERNDKRTDAMQSRASEVYVLKDGGSPRGGLVNGKSSGVSIKVPWDRHAKAVVAAKAMFPSPPKASVSSSRPAPPRRIHVNEFIGSVADSSMSTGGRKVYSRPMTDGDVDSDPEEDIPVERVPYVAQDVAADSDDLPPVRVASPSEETPNSGRVPLTAPRADVPTLGGFDDQFMNEEDRISREGGPEPIHDSVALSVAQELEELRKTEQTQSSDRAMRTVTEADEVEEEEEEEEEEETGEGAAGEEEGEDELETRRIRHIHMVVNQLIDEESSILTELSSHPDYIAFKSDNQGGDGPCRDPLFRHTDGKGASSRNMSLLPSPRSPLTRHKSQATDKVSYKAAIAQQRERDVMTLRGLAMRDSVISAQGLSHESVQSELATTMS